MTVEIAPCSPQAASYACKNWHYSGSIPVGKTVKLGLWEDGVFRGVVMFSDGASPKLGSPLGFEYDETTELTRIAMRSHTTPVTHVVSRALKVLKETSPGLRIVVSFADPNEGHLGLIYQAGNWLYTGRGQTGLEFYVNGRWVHNRAVSGVSFYPKPGDKDFSEIRASVPSRRTIGKFRYVYPLDKAARRRVLKLALPYPKELVDA